MARLLVVEDEPKMQRILQRSLESEGYQVVLSSNGDEGHEILARGGFDGVILDWMLPGRDGLEILKEIRQSGSRVPVLLLTARDAIEDRVAGLDCGADDYLVKPFATVELLARVRAMLRRGTDDRVNVMRTGELEVDLLERRVRRAGVDVSLRPREYELLLYLMRHHGRTVSREMLGWGVWNEALHDLTNVIDVTIAQLRRSLEQPGRPPLIETVRGIGFRLRG